jgi:hypothetical protein
LADSIESDGTKGYRQTAGHAERVAPAADVPSRQLVPANIASPVPAALNSTAIVPPELRELASLLREAPPAWIPATEALLAKLERQQHFISLRNLPIHQTSIARLRNDFRIRLMRQF